MEYVEPIRNRKTIDDIKKILKATNLRDYCLFTLGINSGLRICDLLNLKIKDVMDKKPIHNKTFKSAFESKITIMK